MIGMARKKENSVADFRFKLSNIPPIIVAPDLETPGMSAKHWNRPISNAVLNEICSTLL